jgi:hypothetical protein
MHHCVNALTFENFGQRLYKVLKSQRLYAAVLVWCVCVCVCVCVYPYLYAEVVVWCVLQPHSHHSCHQVSRLITNEGIPLGQLLSVDGEAQAHASHLQR